MSWRRVNVWIVFSLLTMGVFLAVISTLTVSQTMYGSQTILSRIAYTSHDRYNRPLDRDGTIVKDGWITSENQPKSATKDKYGPAVVLLTYMRSGSSLVGDILQQSPGALYVFEPFRSVWHIVLNSNNSVHYVDGTSREQPFDFVDEAVDNLRQWLTCNTSRLQTGGLSDPFLDFGKKTAMFGPCMKEEKTANTSHEETMKICAAKLKPICQESPIRIMKTIRLPLVSLMPLFDELPGLKVVHLVRDPRPTMESQANVGECSEKKHGGKEGCTNKYCTFLENNILQQETLRLKYPGRIMTVLYEDVATKPQETSREMYKFLGTTFTEQAQEYVHNITMAGNEDNCEICTTRGNSTKHVEKWKQSMKPDFIKIVQSRCNYVLQHLGYEMYSPTLKKI